MKYSQASDTAQNDARQDRWLLRQAEERLLSVKEEARLMEAARTINIPYAKEQSASEDLAVAAREHEYLRSQHEDTTTRANNLENELGKLKVANDKLSLDLTIARTNLAHLEAERSRKETDRLNPQSGRVFDELMHAPQELDEFNARHAEGHPLPQGFTANADDHSFDSAHPGGSSRNSPLTNHRIEEKISKMQHLHEIRTIMAEKEQEASRLRKVRFNPEIMIFSDLFVAENRNIGEKGAR